MSSPLSRHLVWACTFYWEVHLPCLGWLELHDHGPDLVACGLTEAACMSMLAPHVRSAWASPVRSQGNVRFQRLSIAASLLFVIATRPRRMRASKMMRRWTAQSGSVGGGKPGQQEHVVRPRAPPFEGDGVLILDSYPSSPALY